MIYKYSDEYDEFVCIESEKEFIENFLNGVKNYSIAKEQLFKIYELEMCSYKMSIEDGDCCKEEFLLLSNLFSRNKMLIESVEFERKNINNIYNGVVKSYKEKIKELNFNIFNLCIVILNKKDNKKIFGKKRDINLYIDSLEKMTGKGREILNKSKTKI